MSRLDSKQKAIDSGLCGAEFIDQLCIECCNAGITACPYVLDSRPSRTWRTTFSEVPNGYHFFIHGDKREWVRQYDDAMSVGGHEELRDICPSKKVRLCAAIAAKAAS